MKHYNKLKNIFKKISHLNHVSAICGWDEACMMPQGGGAARANAMATLQGIQHNLLTNPNVGELIDKAKNESLDHDWDKANLAWMQKQYLNATCLPESLVEEKAKTAMECEQAWRTLRAENNWHDFEPLLEKNFQLVKEAADIRAEKFKLSSYDVLLDDFSPGITQALIEPIFSQLKDFLPGFIPQVLEKQKSISYLDASGHYPHAKQKQLGMSLMSAIGFNFDHGRIDISHHPFCGGVPQDVRITTRYNEEEFITSLMAICHETGHAMYEQGLPQTWLDQPVGLALGMSVHESQSLLMEMQACRSIEFMHFLSEKVKTAFGNNQAYAAENLHHLYTQVKPDYIRVDADEVTYPLHVILRYEIEKDLFSNKIRIKDLPEVWDTKMQQYLNITTKDNYKNGVMQDVHWPAGIFGYFPAYTLGALIAAQLFQSAVSQHESLLSHLKQGDFSILLDWLRKNIHQNGSKFSFNELMENATGEVLNPDYFIAHLKRRYL